MKSNSTLLALFSLSLLALTGCSVKSNVESLFPQIDGGSGDAECPASYAPISLENPTATLVNIADVEKAGTLSYAGTEFYFEIVDSAGVYTQLHATESTDGNLNRVCSRHYSEGYPAGTSLIVKLSVPTAKTESGVDSENFMLQATDSYYGYSSGTGGFKAGNMEAVLKDSKMTYKLYDLGGGAFELRTTETTDLDGRFSANKSAVVRFQFTAKASLPSQE